jgi:hypothetical protein
MLSVQELLMQRNGHETLCDETKTDKRAKKNENTKARVRLDARRKKLHELFLTEYEKPITELLKDAIEKGLTEATATFDEAQQQNVVKRCDAPDTKETDGSVGQSQCVQNLPFVLVEEMIRNELANNPSKWHGVDIFAVVQDSDNDINVMFSFT